MWMSNLLGWEGIKKGKRNIAPLQPLTLATFRSWGIQQELVVSVCQGEVIEY